MTSRVLQASRNGDCSLFVAATRNASRQPRHSGKPKALKIPAMGTISLANWRRPSIICVKTRIFVSRVVPRLIAPPECSLVAHVPEETEHLPSLTIRDPDALQAPWKALDRAEDLIQS